MHAYASLVICVVVSVRSQEMVLSFVHALAVCLSYKDFQELSDRATLLAEALSDMDEKFLPSRQSANQGTLLGSTLTAFTEGKRILSEARLGLSQCKTTQAQLAPFFEKLESFGKALKALCSSYVSLSDQVFATLSALAQAISKTYTQEMSGVLPEFMPSSETDCVKGVMRTWLRVDATGTEALLTPILHVRLTAPMLLEWVNSTAEQHERSDMAFAITTVLTPLLQNNCPIYRNAARAHRLAQWMARCSAFMQVEDPEASTQLDDVAALQKGYKDVTKPFDASAEEAEAYCAGMGAAMQPPLLAPGGDFCKRASAIVSAKGQQLCAPIRQAFETVFGEVPLRARMIEGLSPSTLEHIASTLVPSSAYQSAIEFSKSTGDDLMHLQLQACHRVYEFRRAMAKAEQVAKVDLLEGKELKERRASQRQCDVIQEQRSRYSALDKFFELNSHAFDVDVINSEALHVDTFDTMMDWVHVASMCGKDVFQLESRFSRVWSADLSNLRDAINTFCPQWASKRETILSEEPLAQEFMNMPQAHYEAIGPLTREVDRQLKLIAGISGAPLIDPALCKSCKTAIKFGVTTVVFRFVVVTTRRDFVKLTSEAECSKAVNSLYQAISGKHVPLTSQMENELEAWATGKTG